MSMLVNPYLAPSGTGDPFLASVVLLLGADGADGATTFTDESPVGRTLTASGNAQIDTAQSKFGGGSALFDGSHDYISAPDSADWDLGTGDFTMEGFFRFAATPSTAILMTQWPGGWAWWFLSGSLGFRSGPTLTDTIGYTWSPTLNQWYHLAIDRAGTTYRLYVDGVKVVKDVGFGASLSGSSSVMALGSLDPGGFSGFADFNGWMDEVRITKGVARYASDSGFTVPTAAYPRS